MAPTTTAERCRGQVGERRYHATLRNASTCRNHPSSWFQLAKLRLPARAHHFILFSSKRFRGFVRSAFGLRIELMWERCGK